MKVTKKTEVIPVGGFIDSGKTSFIAQMMEEGDVLLTAERGDVHVEGEIYEEEFPLELFQAHGSAPHIFVELNGTKSYENLYRLFETKAFRKEFFVREAIFLLDPSNYFHVREYFPEIYGRDLLYFDTICVREHPLQKKVIHDLRKRGVEAKLLVEEKGEWKDADTIKESIYMLLALFFVTFTGIYLTMNVNTKLHGSLSQILLNFKALFLEALPFFLLGSLLSSVIRHYVRESHGWIRPHKSKIVSTLKGVVSGVFMPICDCAGVPVSMGLLQRGADDSFTLGFMLSSPLLNPIVLVSTFVAYGSWSMVGLRFLAGICTIVVAVLAWNGLGLMLKQPKVSETFCNCDICVGKGDVKGWRKVRSVLLLTSEEFLKNVGVLTLGIGISSILKVMLPSAAFVGWIAVPVAVLLAYFFSLCSSSDAFVARALFLDPSSAVAFLVAGPIMDLKNSLVFSKSQGWKNTVYMVFLVMLSTILTVALLGLGGLV